MNTKNEIENNAEVMLKLRALEKENRILKRKLEHSNAERAELEDLFAQTRKLLETVAQERLNEEVQKRLTMFRRFVPQEFLQSLDKENWLDIKLGDHVENEMTVLFTDIRSFTAMSEQMTTEDNFRFINNYLRNVYPPIPNNNGFVDKFIGDAIMALFHKAKDAIEAAIAMQRALEQYNQERIANKIVPIEIGIGLHTGKTMIGVIGVENRMQGTVISDAVNIASRLESLTKMYRSALLVSQNVLQNNEDAYETRFLGKVKLLGKSQEIELFEVLPAECAAVFEKKLACKSFFEEGLMLYFDKKFSEASVQFTQVLRIYPEDHAASLYLKNSANYMVNGVPEGWDGVEIFSQK